MWRNRSVTIGSANFRIVGKHFALRQLLQQGSLLLGLNFQSRRTAAKSGSSGSPSFEYSVFTKVPKIRCVFESFSAVMDPSLPQHGSIMRFAHRSCLY